MKKGFCVKCGGETVYCSKAIYPHGGIKADSGYPFLFIEKDARWIPEIYVSQIISYE